MASRQPTPLDALTPYGKRELLRSIRSGEKGITGFSHKSIVRELDAQQLVALLTFLDSSAYVRHFRDDLATGRVHFDGNTNDLVNYVDRKIALYELRLATT